MSAKLHFEARRSERVTLRSSRTSIAIKLCAALLFTGFCGFSAFAAGINLRPGRYSLTVTYEVQGRRQNESRNITRCIRARDLDNPEKLFNDQVPATPKHADTCSVKDLKSAGGSISYYAACLNRTVHVAGSVNATSFAVLRTVTPKASRGVTLKVTVRGTRIGDCSGAKGPLATARARNSAQRKR